jgi:hypothetical protein
MLVGVSRPSEVNTDILRCGISQNVGVKVEKNSKEIETEIAENCLFIISLVAHPTASLIGISAARAGQRLRSTGGAMARERLPAARLPPRQAAGSGGV